MFIATLLLVVSLPSLTSGQRTDVELDSCTYSFVVQSSQCWRDNNSVLETEVAKLRETVVSLSDRLKDVDEAMKGMKEESSTAVNTIRPTTLTAANDGRTVYIYLGCPQHMNINIVYFVPISHVPSTVQVITVNLSDTDNGLRMLLRPTLPPFPVFCTIDKYITIQRRRFPGSDSFNASWEEYREGFGDVSGEFWLGLEKLYMITGQPHMKYSLRLEIKLLGGWHFYSEYNDFHIADESQKYKVLSIGQKIASSANYFLKVGSVFATPDNDQKYKCGSRYNGFWYYENSNRGTIGCSQITFNSDVFPLWYKTSGTTELTEMKIRLQGV